MDTEFHYWMTGIVARRAGFEEAEARVIAYAAEYVDANDMSLVVVDRRNGTKYRNFISQTMNILRPKQEIMRIYPIFHFVPGQPDAVSARRRDGKMHLLNCTPDNEYANAFMDAAFDASEYTRLYRIGIASHAYADTWAHQNFVGWHDSFNAIGTDSEFSIGHMDAGHLPDWPGCVWHDPRLVEPEVDNTERMMAACRALFGKFCAYLAGKGRGDRHGDWPALEAELREAVGRRFRAEEHPENPHRERRLRRYRSLAPWLPEFDERTWFDEAIRTRVRGLRDSHDGLMHLLTVFHDEHFFRGDRVPETTHWYRFQEAVKEHERFGIRLLSPLFRTMGFELASV